MRHKAIRKARASAEWDTRQMLAPFVVPNPGEFTGVSRQWCYPGRCYQMAARFLFHNAARGVQLPRSARLVYGVYAPGEFYLNIGHIGHIGHGWVDLGNGIVFDGVQQEFYDAGGYTRIMNAVPLVRYTVRRAARLAGEHEHWDMWPDYLRAVRAWYQRDHAA